MELSRFLVSIKRLWPAQKLGLPVAEKRWVKYNSSFIVEEHTPASFLERVTAVTALQPSWAGVRVYVAAMCALSLSTGAWPATVGAPMATDAISTSSPPSLLLSTSTLATTAPASITC